MTYWQLVGPAGIPEPILDRMQRAVKQVLAEPNVQARMAEQGADIVGSTPAETAAFVRSEIEKWGAVIRDNNIRADS
ncbi:MAG: hypothetical protein B7Z53_06430 [Rhodospirillales bacterium 12-71-4]|nr:MAG: hypothetical protein B7Z53_06430 [Rhodospirillales bacterium 12-71-4]